MDTPRWLTDEEQAAWRSWIEVMRLLPSALEDGLNSRDKLNLTDYQVLVELSESEEKRLRMTELAARTNLSKSRLSHQIRRMEEHGLITRAECPDDRRGSFAELTPGGQAAIDAAAPGHVEDVRRLFFDQLTPAHVASLGQAMAAVADVLHANPHTR